jgi:hypothetical protein
VGTLSCFEITPILCGVLTQFLCYIIFAKNVLFPFMIHNNKRLSLPQEYIYGKLPHHHFSNELGECRVTIIRCCNFSNDKTKRKFCGKQNA